jgi:hypothetical protein
MKYKKLVNLVKALMQRNNELQDKINILEYRISILERNKQPFAPVSAIPQGGIWPAPRPKLIPYYPPYTWC